MRVYVAGPMTKGDQLLNIRQAIEAGNRIQEAGHTVFVPHLSAQWHILYPHNYEWWMDWCLDWLETCDVLIRLAGLSSGADREVTFAREHGIEVFLGFSGDFWNRLRVENATVRHMIETGQDGTAAARLLRERPGATMIWDGERFVVRWGE